MSKGGEKRAKKFNKKHLQSHLKQRRVNKAIKDKNLKKDKDKTKKEKKKQKIAVQEQLKNKSRANEAESSDEEKENEINLLKPTKKSKDQESQLDADFEGLEVLQDDVEISSDEEVNNDMDVSDEEGDDSDDVEDDEDAAMDISDDEIEAEDDDNDEEEDSEEEKEEEEEEDKKIVEEDANGDVESMKQDMAALKEKDPEFYKYLQENDKSLLDFDVQDEEDDDDDEVDDQEVDEVEDDDDDENSDKSVLVSLKLISGWEQQIAEKKSLKACNQLLNAFKAGAHLHDQKKEDEEETQPSKYKISNDKAFNQLMVKTMKLIPTFFNETIKFKPNNNKLPNTYQSWKAIHVLAKSYLSSCLHMLQQLTEPTMLIFMLDRFESILVYFASFPKLSRELVKTLLKLFGSAQDDKVRLLAFITLKNLSRSSKEFLDLALKGVYMSYIRSAKNITAFNLSQIEMMRNCGVELFGQDFSVSYQHAFQFIRRLAMHLRTSLTNKTKDSYQQVYNFQFIHSIYFWSQVLSSYCNANQEQENGESPLKPLIYPFVQVTLGTLSLIPSPKYFPLKLHCIKALIPIMQSTKIYIPIAPYLIEMLESSEFQKKPKPSTEKPLNFDVVIKAPKTHLRTKPYQDELSRLINECFLAYFSSLSTTIAFPEIVLPTTLYLKRFAKKTAPNTPKFVQILLTKIKETSDFVNQKRENVRFNPTNLNSLKTFMRDTDVFKTPLGQQYKQIVKVNQSRKRTLQTQNDDE